MSRLLLGTLFVLGCGYSHLRADEPAKQEMFEIEKTQIVRKEVEIRGCRVAPKKWHVLFVCRVRFTDAGSSLPAEQFAKLKVSKASKEFAAVYGPLIAKGDFQLRLKDKSLVPCSCLPLSEEESGPKVMLESKAGEDDWLMYVGAVQILAGVKPDAQPEALIWGGKYEFPIPKK